MALATRRARFKPANSGHPSTGDSATARRLYAEEPVKQALAALPEEQRACVVLVDVEGLEYAEAATALGVPIGTVRSRLARARLHLHALLYGYARERRRTECRPERETR